MSNEKIMVHLMVRDVRYTKCIATLYGQNTGNLNVKIIGAYN